MTVADRIDQVRGFKNRPLSGHFVMPLTYFEISTSTTVLYDPQFSRVNLGVNLVETKVETEAPDPHTYFL